MKHPSLKQQSEATAVIQMSEEPKNETKINKKWLAVSMIGHFLVICGFISMALYFTRHFTGFFDFDYSILFWVFFHVSGFLFLGGAWIWQRKSSGKSLSAVQTT